MYEELQKLYTRSEKRVRSSRISEQEALEHYGEYVEFVSRASPPGSLLDIGCGNGWSSYLFSKREYRTVGADLNAQAFEPFATGNLRFAGASVLNLPFRNASFDVVAAYQMLEHTPSPSQALDEMLRVLKHGGILCIVGPNLLSLGMSVKAIGKYVWRNRPVRRVFIRDAQTPNHPFGNTIFEALGVLPLNAVRIMTKLLSNSATFEMRDPDVVPPFDADNDACYLCNPIDLDKFLSGKGCTIIQNRKHGRLLGTGLLAGGTWIIARKQKL